MNSAARWDIFCNVVDHFGDIAVSWRLARQLRAEYGFTVTLYVDDLATFAVLCPTVDRHRATQEVEGVRVRHWTDATDFGAPGDVVVDAFGSRAPGHYLEAMAQRTPRSPVWINLEYLSAEDWIEDCHAVGSPHPRLPLTRHFFFPGFSARTGGVLAERDLARDRLAFLGDAAARSALRESWKLPPPDPGTPVVSLFGYGGPSVGTLLKAWSDGAEPIDVLVPESRVLPDVAAFFGSTAAGPGATFARGALDVHVIPFQTQATYDRLLWLCDCNFVRGEDSFVRAQWAEHPFVWNIYAQEGGAHWAKMHAFVSRYGAGLEEDAVRAVRDFWRLWNRGETDAGVIGAAWRRFWHHREELQAHNAAWAANLRSHGDLAANLVRFAVERL